MANDDSESAKFLIVGDSLSAAHGLPEDQGWVALLDHQWRQTNPNIQIVNASVSGATTAAGLSRLPELLRQYRPKWMVLELGGNDGLQGKPLRHIRSNLQQMVNLAQLQGTAVYIVGMRLPPNLGRRYTEPFFEQYAQLAEQTGSGYYPFLLEGVAGEAKLMQSDGIHPSAAGQRRVFEQIEAPVQAWVARH